MSDLQRALIGMLLLAVIGVAVVKYTAAVPASAFDFRCGVAGFTPSCGSIER